MIIGLSGYARSGKDTVAGMLMGLHGFDNKAFAGPMREALYRLNPIISWLDGTDTPIRLQATVDSLGWDKAKVNSPEVRRLLQTFGTEVGRNFFEEDMWVDMAFEQINIDNNIVFTDVRFPNEAYAIQSVGGQVWRVERPGVEAINSHVSEFALDDWDFDKTVVNDGDLDSLKIKIKEALGK